ncbi:MMPL family transporter [bacterium]|nr:MAG: MMPL family transporter [bacterium]
MKTILSNIAEFCYKHARFVIPAVAVLTTVSIYYMLQIKISTNNFDLLPQNSKLIKEFWEVNEDFGAQDRHITLIETPDSLPADADLLKSFAGKLDEALMGTGMVVSCNYSITDNQKTFIEEFFIKNGLLYLSSADLDSVLKRFDDAEIERLILNCKNILNAPVPPDPLLKKILREDPLLISEMFLPYVEKMLGRQNASLLKDKESYYLSKDKKTLLFFVKPTGASNDTKFCEAFVDRNDIICDSLLASLGEERDEIKISFGGNYVSALSNARAVKQGLIDSSFIVIILILVLFYLFYGNLRALFFIMAPIMAGVSWVFCVGDLMFEKFNIITAAAGAMLLGLGVDYSIHIYNRFIEQERHSRHNTILQNLIITFGETGTSVFYGVVSTAFVFAVLMITKFRGLYELGFIGGVGILILFMAVLIIMPAEIKLRDRKPHLRGNYLQLLLSKLLGLLSRFVLRHPKYITTGSIVITTFMVAVLFGAIPSRDKGIGVTFDENIENIRSKNDVDVKMIKRLQEKFGSHFKPISVVCSATTDEALIQKLHLLNDKMDRLETEGVVKEYNSLLRYLPSVEHQRVNLDKIGSLDVESILFKIRLEMTKQGLRMNYFRLERLRRMLTVSEPITIHSFQNEGFGDIMQHYYVEKNGLKKVVTQVELTGPTHDINIVNNFIKDVETDPKLADQNIIITGIRVVTAEFLTLVKKDFVVALIASLIAVLVLVVIKYWNLRAVIVCMVPLTFSILAIMGVMRLLGIKINFVNMISLPLLIGSGVDYGIYIISRYLEDQRHDVFAAIHETGQSMFLSALTTVMGFGSLIFVDNQGLSSLGYMCSIGIIICSMSSVIILPAMLRLWGKRIWKPDSSVNVADRLTQNIKKPITQKK